MRKDSNVGKIILHYLKTQIATEIRTVVLQEGEACKSVEVKREQRNNIYLIFDQGRKLTVHLEKKKKKL